ncbi:MAG: hypothetical protein AB8H86_04805 [Polyangiales bacterium]
MAKEPRNRAWAFAFTVSLGLHLLVGGREAAEAAQPGAQRDIALNMEVLWQEIPPAPEPTVEEAPEPPRVVEELVEEPRARRAPARLPRPDTPAEPGAGSQQPAGEVSASGEAGPTTEAPATDAADATPTFDIARLQPSAVAQGTFGPRLPTAQDEESAMEAALQADLYRIANAAPYDTVRPAPELRETGDGGFTYDGHLFSARISPSGEVSFDDAPGIGFAGLGGPSGTLGVGFSFDISAAAERAAGNDPNSAERRWFMEQTRRVRERLQGEDRARIQGRGLVRLRRQLREIWESTKPIRERREEVFRLWDSCEEDEVGAQARGVILEFIRDHPGEEGGGVFPAEELRRLNASRVSRERFAP